jgi:putative DNA primase/helicase
MYQNLEHLKQALICRAVELVTEINGDSPNSRLTTKKEMRWGSKGSFVLTVSGRKSGLWYDHELGVGGDLLALIQHRVCGGTFPRAVDWARTWLGWSPDDPRGNKNRKFSRSTNNKEKKSSQIDDQGAADELSRIANARNIWDKSKPLEKGGSADLYLRQTRGIQPSNSWPDSVRFRTGSDQAVVFGLTMPDGKISAVQIIRINNDGTKRLGGNLSQTKQTYGVIKGAAIRFEGQSDQPLCVAEGPETGLSVWSVTGLETWVTAGQSNIQNLPFPRNRKIIFCNDDSPRNSPSLHQAKKLLKKLKRNGYDVVAASPWRVRRGDKSDFNDLLIKSGPEAIQKRIDLAINRPKFINDELVSLKEGEILLENAVRRYFEETLSHFFMPYYAIQATVGLGKTEVVLRQSVLLCLTSAPMGQFIMIA